MNFIIVIKDALLIPKVMDVFSLNAPSPITDLRIKISYLQDEMLLRVLFLIVAN